MLTYLQTLAKYLSKIKRNCEQLDANQKLRRFMFNIKTVPYCSGQHILKAASFTLKVNTHFSLVTSGCQMVTDQSLGFL